MTGGVTTRGVGLIMGCGEEHHGIFRFIGLGEETKAGKGEGSR